MYWENLNEVPSTIAMHKGARLSFDQVQQVVGRAYELKEDSNPNLGAAWVEFEQDHFIASGLWIKKVNN